MACNITEGLLTYNVKDEFSKKLLTLTDYKTTPQFATGGIVNEGNEEIVVTDRPITFNTVDDVLKYYGKQRSSGIFTYSNFGNASVAGLIFNFDNDKGTFRFDINNELKVMTPQKAKAKYNLQFNVTKTKLTYNRLINQIDEYLNNSWKYV